MMLIFTLQNTPCTLHTGEATIPSGEVLLVSCSWVCGGWDNQLVTLLIAAKSQLMLSPPINFYARRRLLHRRCFTCLLLASLLTPFNECIKLHLTLLQCLILVDWFGGEGKEVFFFFNYAMVWVGTNYQLAPISTISCLFSHSKLSPIIPMTLSSSPSPMNCHLIVTS